MRLIPNREEVDDPATAEDLETTGFVENWGAALGLSMSEDLPIVSRMIPPEVETSRRKKINDYLKSGDIPYSAAMFYGSDFNGLAGYARDTLGLEGFFTDEEYREHLEQEYKQRRDYSQSIFDKATIWGKIGQFAGTAHAYAIDPVYAVSALTGYGAAATVGQAILRTALVQAGVEAVAQPFKMSFKESIGVDYGAPEALTEIAFAGIGAGLLAGAGKGISKAIHKRFGTTFAPEDLTVRETVEVFEQMVDRAPELKPVLNTLKHANPDDNALKVLTADEAIDARRANEGPLRFEAKGTSDEVLKAEEEAFLARQPMKPDAEGVPRGTPTVKQRGSKELLKALKKVKDAEAHPKIAEDSAAGKNARAKLAQRKAAMEKLRAAAPEEGVPRGTPTTEPGTRHPMVVEADNVANSYDEAIKIMEDCF